MLLVPRRAVAEVEAEDLAETGDQVEDMVEAGEATVVVVVEDLEIEMEVETVDTEEAEVVVDMVVEDVEEVMETEMEETSLEVHKIYITYFTVYDEMIMNLKSFICRWKRWTRIWRTWWWRWWTWLRRKRRWRLWWRPWWW